MRRTCNGDVSTVGDEVWLAYHGVNTLRARYWPDQIQAVFLHVLSTARNRRPAGWDHNWGVGVVDAGAVLGASLPDPGDIAQGIGAFGSADGLADRLSALLAAIAPDELRTALSKMLGLAVADLDARLRRFEGELAYRRLEEDDFRESLLASSKSGRLPRGAGAGLGVAGPARLGQNVTRVARDIDSRWRY